MAIMFVSTDRYDPKDTCKQTYEWISEGRSENRSTALTKRFCESQNRVWISKTVRDMTMILFSSYRSSRGGSKVQTTSSFDV